MRHGVFSCVSTHPEGMRNPPGPARNRARSRPLLTCATGSSTGVDVPLEHPAAAAHAATTGRASAATVRAITVGASLTQATPGRLRAAEPRPARDHSDVTVAVTNTDRAT